MYRLDVATPKVLLKWYFNYQLETKETIPFNEKRMDERVSLWVHSWKNICNLQEKYNFKTIIMLQPILGAGEKKLSFEEEQNVIFYDTKLRNQKYESYANALDNLDLTCTATFDLRNSFDSHTETIYYDSGHVGDNGNKIMAEKIYENILPIVLEDLSK